jgi:hypothetical protein
VTGPLTNAEIAVRSSSGLYLFVPHGYDDRIITQCGLRVVVCEDRTSNMAEIAERRRNARESRNSALRRIEGHAVYEKQAAVLLCRRSGRQRRPALALRLCGRKNLDKGSDRRKLPAHSVGVAWNLNDCSKRRVGESRFASCRLCFWALLVLGRGVFFSYYPVFWSIPTMVLSRGQLLG